ncbi:dNA mismatch endonuclease patch repair protein Vsr [Fusobacterium sp. CAG:439]|nr:dNA mismatch endonuclease patch repair protein Vsr [Fusobacterium sp. CAG:439]
MRAIQSRGTKIEVLVCKALWNNGIRYRKNVKTLPGKPDIAIKKSKIVIFLDSCFWHKCPLHFKRPKSNLDYWDKKIARNVERDKEVNNFYIENSWHILRIWEHQLNNKEEIEHTIKDIIDFIRKYQ